MTALAVAAFLLPCAAGPALPGRALAQADVGAQSLLIDPSIRAAGMGRAGVAAFWGDDPNDWANPALLGYRQGIAYEWTDMQLVPDLADDVGFDANRWSLAWCGIGVRFAGRGVGEQRLDYGETTATDPDGNEIGTFHSYEEIETIALGVSAAGVIRAISDLTGNEPPPFLRRFDFAFGQAWNTVTVDFAPPGMTQGGEPIRGTADTQDFGVLLRLTPYNSLEGGDLLPGLERSLRGRLEVGLGYADRGYDNSTITIGAFDPSDPLPRVTSRAVSVHLALTPAEAAMENRPWFYDIVSPLFSIGATWQRDQPKVHSVDSGEPIDRWGVEIVAANLMTFRVGNVEDPTGTIHGSTAGWGLGLRYGRIAGVRYDRANVPQSVYLERNDHLKGLTAFVDPIALWGKLR